MSHQLRVLFRVDAGPDLGLGHLQRSLSLAIALGKLGMDSLFLTNENESSRQRIKGYRFPLDTLALARSWTSEDIKTTVDVAARNECDAVVVDCRFAHADYLAKLRSAGPYLIARDDLAIYPFPCQMVVNGNADACRLPYHSSSNDTVFLLGLDYMVLRPEFGDEYLRTVGGGVANILVILGGSDQYDLMPEILGVLDSLPGNFSVTAVVGPYFHNAAAVMSVARNSKRQIKLVHNPDSVRGLMLEADLAVSAAGQALYELACVGCPTVAIQTAPDQGGQMAALAEAGSLIAAGDAQTDNVTAAINEAVTYLKQSPDVRHQMANAGQTLVDGKGALRVAGAIVESIPDAARSRGENSPNPVS